MEKISMKGPFFSVIIPLFNKGPYIARAINSVFNQTIQNFEIIVVDGGSEDNGPKIVKEFNDSRIYFLVQRGKGVSNARNAGVNSTKNEFIAFLDADDEWMPNYLETIIRLIKKYPEAGMFTTAYKIQTGDGKIGWADYKCIPKPPWEGLLPDYFKSGALGESPVWTSVAVIPNKIFHEIGGFHEGYWFGEDADLFGRIALKYPVAFGWDFGAIYHKDAINRACDRRLPLENEEPFVITARAALMVGEVPQKFRESLNEYICRKEIIRAYRNVRAGHSDIAQSILKHCNTKWHYNEKTKWLLLAKIPYPLYLFIRDIRRKLIKMVRKNALNTEKCN
jgi:glycosyltransferase involved in cell wall biosynthesis